MKKTNTVFGLVIFAKIILSKSSYIKLIKCSKEKKDYEGERKYICEASKAFSNELLERFDTKLNIVHPERIPENGPVVYVANHQSYCDVFAFISMIPHQIGFVAKKEFSRIPIFNKWLSRIRSVYIDRSTPRASLTAINDGVRNLHDGFSMVIFPEGHRSRSHEMRDFKYGSFKLATKAGVPIIPVTLDGGYKTFEQDKAFVSGHTVNALIHEPINTKDLSRDELVELPKFVESTIRDGLKYFE